MLFKIYFKLFKKPIQTKKELRTRYLIVNVLILLVMSPLIGYVIADVLSGIDGSGFAPVLLFFYMFFVFFAFGVLLNIIKEKKDFKNLKCPKCGERMIDFQDLKNKKYCRKNITSYEYEDKSKLIEDHTYKIDDHTIKTYKYDKRTSYSVTYDLTCKHCGATDKKYGELFIVEKEYKTMDI